MDKERIINFLENYGFKYSQDAATITVHLDFAHNVKLDFSRPDKMKISDQLTGWNFLTGLIPMSLKNAVIYNFIGAIVAGFIFVFLASQQSGVNLTGFYLAFMLWVLLFSGYYLIKLESFKIQLMNAITSESPDH